MMASLRVNKGAQKYAYRLKKAYYPVFHYVSVKFEKKWARVAGCLMAVLPMFVQQTLHRHLITHSARYLIFIT